MKPVKKHNNAKYGLDQPPPHSEGAEINIIGAMMLNKAAALKATELIRLEYFFFKKNAIIFEAAKELVDKNIGVEITSIAEYLHRQGKLESVGGTYYLTEINSKVPTSANIEYNCLLVKEYWIKRQLLHESGQTINNILNHEDVLSEIGVLNSRLYELIDECHIQNAITSDRLATEMYEHIQENQKGRERGYNTGFVTIDKKTNGLQPGLFYVIGARPSVGKTRLITSIITNTSIRRDVSVGMLSLEMQGKEIGLSLMANFTGIGLSDLLYGKILDEGSKTKISRFLEQYSNRKVIIDDSPYMTVDVMMAKARQMRYNHGIRILFIDYLQMVSDPTKQTLREEINSISRACKRIAKELQIPVVAAAQLNRAPEARKSQKPQLYDLKESGNIEQDADVVLLPERPAVNGKDFDDKQPGLIREGVSRCRLHIAKQRNGPKNVYESLCYYEETGRFISELNMNEEEYEKIEYEEPPGF